MLHEADICIAMAVHVCVSMCENQEKKYLLLYLLLFTTIIQN